MAADLHVVDQGQGIPVVWIHGFPLSALLFEQQLLIPGVRHIVPDLPGFGQSPPVEIESIDDYGLAVLDVLEERSIDRAVIAGVSMGGYVAFSILRQRPGLASALVLIDTREGPDSAEGRAKRFSQIDRVEVEGPAFLIDDMLPLMLTSETRQLDDYRTDLVRRTMKSASAAGTKSALRAMAGRPDSTDTLRLFRNPVLVLVGSADEITPPSDAERMASIATSSTLAVIPDAAHLSNVERPALFNEAVLSFLAQRP